MERSPVAGLLNSSTRLVFQYYAYKATTAVEFYRPIMYLFFLAQGLSFTQIAILEAIYNLTTVLGEVPSGYVGDRVGRRNSLLIGTTVIALALVGIGLSGSFFVFAVFYVFWSMGYNFRSGSEDAWLYDALTDQLAEDEFAHIRGRGESVSLAVGVVGAVTGGYLGSINLSYPFFVAASVTALGVIVLITMDEPETTEAVANDELGIGRTLEIVQNAISRRDLRSFIIYYYVVFAAVTYLVFMYLQPVFETVVVDLGVSRSQVESLLGWFYSAYSLLGAALSYYTGTIKERIGIRAWFLGMPFLVGGALVGMFFIPILALPTLLFTRGVADVTRTFASQYVNDRIASLGRATVLSAMAMVSGLTVIPFQLGSGILSDQTTPLFVLAIAGAVMIGASALIFLWDAPIKDERLHAATE